MTSVGASSPSRKRRRNNNSQRNEASLVKERRPHPLSVGVLPPTHVTSTSTQSTCHHKTAFPTRKVTETGNNEIKKNHCSRRAMRQDRQKMSSKKPIVMSDDDFPALIGSSSASTHDNITGNRRTVDNNKINPTKPSNCTSSSIVTNPTQRMSSTTTKGTSKKPYSKSLAISSSSSASSSTTSLSQSSPKSQKNDATDDVIVEGNEPKTLSNSQLKKLRWKEWRKRQKEDQRLGLDSRMQEQRDQLVQGKSDSSSESLVINDLRRNNSKSEITDAVAIDCEMVGAGPRGCRDMVARVSVVNTFGHVLYDTYVAPVDKVTDYRTFVSGIYPHHLKNAADFKVVQGEVCSLLKDRILVGHALDNDLKVLYLTHPKEDIRDTAKYFSPEDYGGHGPAPSLKRLTQHHLGVKIQKSSHDSVEDARAAMRLYVLFRKSWEESMSK